MRRIRPSRELTNGSFLAGRGYEKDQAVERAENHKKRKNIPENTVDE